MFIVDSQVHIWREETPDRPWVPGARERMRLNGHREAAFTYQECLELMDVDEDVVSARRTARAAAHAADQG